MLPFFIVAAGGVTILGGVGLALGMSVLIFVIQFFSLEPPPGGVKTIHPPWEILGECLSHPWFTVPLRIGAVLIGLGLVGLLAGARAPRATR